MAGNNSDFSLYVSVQGGSSVTDANSSGKGIYDDLKNIFHKVESQITTKVAVGLDEESLKTLQSQLSNIKNSFTFKINSDAYSKEIEKALKKYDLLKDSSKDSKKTEEERIAAQTTLNKKILEQEEILKRITVLNKIPKASRTDEDNSKLKELRQQRNKYYEEFKADKTGTTITGWEQSIHQQAKEIANATVQAETEIQSGIMQEATVIANTSDTVVNAINTATTSETDAIQKQATEVKKAAQQLSFDDFTEASAESISKQADNVVDDIVSSTQSEIDAVEGQANQLEKAAGIYGEAVKTLSAVISLNPDNTVISTTKTLEGVQTGKQYTERYAASKGDDGSFGEVQLQRIDESNRAIENSMRRVNTLFTDVIKKKDELLNNSVARTFADDLSQDLNTTIQKIQLLQDALGSTEADKFSSFATSEYEDLRGVDSATSAVEKINSLLKDSNKTIAKINSSVQAVDSSFQKTIETVNGVGYGFQQLEQYKESSNDLIKANYNSVDAAYKEVSALRTKLGDIDGKTLGDLDASQVGTYKQLSEAIARYSANVGALTSRVRTEGDAERDLSTSIRARANAITQSNKILAEARKYFNTYKSGIQSNVTAEQKWLDLMGKLKAGGFENDIGGARAQLAALQTETAESGAEIMTLRANIKKLFKDHFGSVSATATIGFLTSSLRKAYDNVVQIDTAMTELRKVTNLTTAEYKKFGIEATASAKQVGATIADTINSAADFARLGYDAKDALDLSEAALVYKNVGDGIDDISIASESLISTMKAFGLQASDSMSIVDKFNEVGNNYAISSVGIGEALQRSAASLSAANNTLDESIALVTAANTVIQDPEAVGTAMKTVSMYLRAAKTEAEEAGIETDGMASSVSKLRDEIKGLSGVDIMIDDSTFKSTYQILKEISKVWGSLTDTTRANLQQMLAGKRQGNILASIITNFDDAEKALASSQNSAGSALAENEKQLDSIQGHITRLATSLEELSQGIINNEAPKMMFDFLRGIVDFLNEMPSSLGAILGLVTAIAVQRKTGSFLEAVVNGEGARKFQIFGRSVNTLKENISNLFLKGQKNLQENLFSEINVLDKYYHGFKPYKDGASKASYIKAAFASDGQLAGLSSNARQAALEISKLSDAYTQGEAVVTKFEKQQLAANKALSLGGKAINAVKTVAAAAGTALVSAGISFAISAIAGAVTDFIDHQKQLEAAAGEAAKRVKEVTTSLYESVSKFKEYRAVLSDNKASIQEVETARTDLLTVQRELNDSYDIEAGKLNLVNGELERQADLILQIGESEYRKERSTNEAGYRNAVRNMTTSKEYDTGLSESDFLPEDPTIEISERQKEILGKISDRLLESSVIKDSLTTEYSLEATPIEMDKKYEEMYEYIRKLGEETGIESEFYKTRIQPMLTRISNLRSELISSSYGEDGVTREMYRQYLEYDSKYKNDYKKLSLLQDQINAAIDSDDLETYDELMAQFVDNYQKLIDTATQEGDTSAVTELSEVFDTSALSDFRGLFSDATSEVAGLSASLVALGQSFGQLKTDTKETLGNLSKLQSAIDKISNGEKLTIDEVNELIDLDASLANSFSKTDGGYVISVEALVTAQNSLSDDAKASIEAQAEEAKKIIEEYLAKVNFIASIPAGVPTSAIEAMLKSNGLWNDLTLEDYNSATNIKSSAELLISALSTPSEIATSTGSAGTEEDPYVLFEKAIEDWKRKNDYNENDANSRKAFADYARAQAQTYFYGAGSLYQSAENYKKAIESVAEVEQKSLEDSYDRGLISYEEYRRGIEELSKKYTDEDGYYILGSQFVSGNVDYDKAYNDAISQWKDSNDYDENDFTKRNELAAAQKSFNEKYFGKDSGNYNPAKLKENYETIETFEGETLDLRIANEKKFLEERNKLIEDAAKERTDAIDEEIDKLKDEQSELEAINEEEEQRLQLIKDRQAVEDAKANRNQLVFANGGYGYEVDQAAVEEALSAVKNDEEAIAKKASDNRIAEKEAEKEVIESEKEEKTGANDKLIEALDNMTEETPQHDAGIISDAITKSLKDEQLSVDDVTKIGEQLKSGNEGLEAVKNGTYVIDTSDLVAQIEKLQNSESGSSGFSAINQLKDAVSKSKGDVYNNSKVSNTYAVSIPAVSISLPGNTPIEMATEFASKLGEALSQKLATIVQ